MTKRGIGHVLNEGHDSATCKDCKIEQLEREEKRLLEVIGTMGWNIKRISGDMSALRSRLQRVEEAARCGLAQMDEAIALHEGDNRYEKIHLRGILEVGAEQIRAALAPEQDAPAEATCKWREAADAPDLWRSSCGNDFTNGEDCDLPGKNDMRWCCFCGKRIEVVDAGEPHTGIDLSADEACRPCNGAPDGTHTCDKI